MLKKQTFTCNSRLKKSRILKQMYFFLIFPSILLKETKNNISRKRSRHLEEELYTQSARQFGDWRVQHLRKPDAMK